MKAATLSADIITYTALPDPAKRSLENNIHKLIKDLTRKYGENNFYGRLIQGDYLEFALKSPETALRIALLLKTFIKSLNLPVPEKEKSRLKHFNEHGARIAVAIAPLNVFDPIKGILDGEAIYISGRAIKNLSTSNKNKIIIKNTFFFGSDNLMLQQLFDPVFSLLDFIFSRHSAKQSEVIFHKLSGLNEKEIAKTLGKTQSTISQHSTAAGWAAIEKTILYFEKTLKYDH